MSKDRSHETEAAEDALARFYEEYFDRVARYIFIRIGDRDESENLAGEVFLRALQSLDSYRGSTEHMRFWLFRIARNMLVDHLRKAGKRKTVPLDTVEIPDRVSVEQVVEERQQMQTLSEALGHLSAAHREVLGLRVFAGLSSAEAGEVLGKSSGAVREMQRAAIETLRKQLNVEAG